MIINGFFNDHSLIGEITLEATHSKKLFSILCTMLMIAIVFQNVLADIPPQTDTYIDEYYDSGGHQHMVWREMDNGTYLIKYSNNIGDNLTGIENGGLSIVHTSSIEPLYPQISVDPLSRMCYVLWLEVHNNITEFWYSGSIDFDNWTMGMYGGILPPVTGDPTMQITSYDFTIYVAWKNDGAKTIIPDLDGDFIPDCIDSNPIEYNVDGEEEFNADAVSVNHEMGVSVAIDYSDNSDISPSIVLSDVLLMDAGVGYAVNITTDSSQLFSAAIKINYNSSSLSENITEKYLRAYYHNGTEWLIMKNTSAGEDTGIDTSLNVVWAITSHFTSIAIADSSLMDSDREGLTDAEEIGADGEADTVITQFSDDSFSKTFPVENSQENTIYIDVPAFTGEIERFDNASLDIDGSMYSFQEEQPILTSGTYCQNPDLYEDKVVYTDFRYGNTDIFMYDLVSEEEVQLSFSPVGEGHPEIWGDYVLWYRSFPDKALILKNYVTGEERIFNEGVGDIYGDYVVYQSTVYGGIALYEISSSTTTGISGDRYGNLCIFDDYVAHTDSNTGSVWLYTISDGSHIEISPSGIEPILIDASDKYVIYSDALSNNDLYSYEISTGENKRITNDLEGQNEPAIYGSIALWTDYRNSEPGESNRDIYGYDLENDIEFPVCLSDGLQASPTIYEDTIAFVSLIDEKYQVCITERITPQLNIKIEEYDVWTAEISISELTSLNFTVGLNNYFSQHKDSDDGSEDGYVSIPINILSNGYGEITLSNLQIELNYIETDPLKDDTDGDYFNDYIDLLNVNGPVVFDTSFHDSGSYNLTCTSENRYPTKEWKRVLNGGQAYMVSFNVISSDTNYAYKFIRPIDGEVIGKGYLDPIEDGWHSFMIDPLPSGVYNFYLQTHGSEGESMAFEDLTITIANFCDSSQYTLDCTSDNNDPTKEWERVIHGGIAYAISFNVISADTNYIYKFVRPIDGEIISKGYINPIEEGWHSFSIEPLPPGIYHFNLQTRGDVGESMTFDNLTISIGSFYYHGPYNLTCTSENTYPTKKWESVLHGGITYAISFNVLSANSNFAFKFIKPIDGEVIGKGYLDPIEIGWHSFTIDPLPPGVYHFYLQTSGGVGESMAFEDVVITMANYYNSESVTLTCESDSDYPTKVWKRVIHGDQAYVVSFDVLSADTGYSYRYVKSMTDEIIGQGYFDPKETGWQSFTIDPLPPGVYHFCLETSGDDGDSMTIKDLTITVVNFYDALSYTLECTSSNSYPAKTWKNILHGGITYTLSFYVDEVNTNYEYWFVSTDSENKVKEWTDYSEEVGWNTVVFTVYQSGVYNFTIQTFSNTIGESMTIKDLSISVASYYDTDIELEVSSDDEYPTESWKHVIHGGYNYRISYHIFEVSTDHVYWFINNLNKEKIMDSFDYFPNVGWCTIEIDSEDLLDGVYNFYIQTTGPYGSRLVIDELKIEIDQDRDGVVDVEDMDPLVDLEVTVKVSEIQKIDSLLDFVFDDPADFYLWVRCTDSEGSEWLKSETTTGYDFIKENDDYIYPDSKFIFNVSDDSEIVEIIITLWDDDDKSEINDDFQDTVDSTDDPCDISIQEGCDLTGENWEDTSAIVLDYNLKTGQWSGDDGYDGDPNGYGHTSGNEDGSTDSDENDCEIWFDIWQGGDGDDGDGLTYWEEVNEYGTDPTYLNMDSDGDGLFDWWEDKYGFDPITTDDGWTDNDGDGLPNLNEQWCGRISIESTPIVDNTNYISRQDYSWGGLPNQQDIFVELDWMTGCKLSNDARENVIRNFAMHGVSLHIDDGTMNFYSNGGDIQGGTEITYREVISRSDRDSLFINEGYDFGNDPNFGFTPTRNGVFYYCLMAYKDEGGNIGLGGGADFVSFTGHYWYNIVAGDLLLAHELGHCILGILDSSHAKEGDTTHCTDTLCIMAYNGISAIFQADYCDDCWNEIIIGGNDNLLDNISYNDGPDMGDYFRRYYQLIHEY